MTTVPRPTEIRLRKSAGVVAVSFDEGSRFELPFEYLRVFSPSAEVRGHGTEILQIGKEHVKVTAVEPVGNYAVRLRFDDGHDTGLYSWPVLWDLGVNHQQNWERYQQRLKDAGYQRKV
ncbi:MAG TPA: gamma-butyrobetaine hydroxylase-like domain-containing protein [Gammaproteobacteria bacterium]|nr:gamma-butyrobetaine hydroxylase-like domain-containing protein [Gammaproteobacteria bacterium]